MSEYSACSVMCLPGALESQKRTLGPLGLELGMVVCHCVSAGDQT